MPKQPDLNKDGTKNWRLERLKIAINTPNSYDAQKMREANKSK